MAKGILIPLQCMLVGKEYSKARGEMVIDGRTIPSHGDEYYIYMLIGTSIMGTDLILGEPVISRKVTVSKSTYNDIHNQCKYNCMVLQRDNRYNIVSIDGIDVLDDYSEYSDIVRCNNA